MFKNNPRFLDFLTRLSEKPGSVYFISANALQLNSRSTKIWEKIQKSQSIAYEIASGIDTQLPLFKELDESLIQIQQLQAPQFDHIPDEIYQEILCPNEHIPWLTQKLQRIPSRQLNFFVTFQDFSKENLSLLDFYKSAKIPIYFEFSHYARNSTTSLSVNQIRQLIAACNDQQVEVRPPPGRPIWDDTIPSDLELEPLEPITFQMGNFEQISFSVIIPTYNCKHYLLNVLRHLGRQNFPAERFEVIVVDDGSSDGSLQYIRNHFERNLEIQNLKYIYWPRPVLRRRGDSYFRAGLSRNLGVHYSAGAYVSFIDSDMLVPANYLNQLECDLSNHDVVQNVRYHILPELSTEYVRHEDVRLNQDTFIEDVNYWGKFFAVNNWSELDAYWKYTCTYNLTLKKDLFLNIGRFRRNFVSYGFEDTDLGFRLAKAGRKFFLSKNICLHLTPEKSQSEYRQSQVVRHFLLSKTAKKFFLNNLDPYIYDHLSIYMNGEYPNLRRWKQSGIRLFSFLKKRLDQV